MSNLTVSQWHQRFVQQAGWTTSVREYLLKKTTVQDNPRILEIGCGTGAVLGETAAKFPLAYGIDFNLDYLRYCQNHAPGAQLAGADAYLLPYPAGSFEIVFCHYFLLWIQDPAAVLQEALRVIKSSGALLVFAEPDYGGRIDYPPALQPLGDAQTASLADQGADPFMGRKLAGLAALFPELVDIEIGIMGYQHTTHQESGFWDREWEILAHDVQDRFSIEEMKTIGDIDRRARQEGSRVLFVPTFYLYAEVRKERGDEK